MTPKEQYERSRNVRRERRMAEDDEWTARKRKEQAADECLTTLLDGIKAFFDGCATLHISPMQPGMGQAVRFVKDRALAAEDAV